MKEASESNIQYVSNDAGDVTAVMVPIKIWEDITTTDTTAYLLSSNVMRERLLRSMKAKRFISLETALERIGKLQSRQRKM